MITAPTIETARLRLCPHRIEDFEPLAALMATGWAVELKQGGHSAGQVGINRYARWPEVEPGWSVWPAHEGKGIARKTAETARGQCRLVSYIAPENACSLAPAGRLGDTPGAGARIPLGASPESCAVYRHPVPEAQQ